MFGIGSDWFKRKPAPPSRTAEKKKPPRRSGIMLLEPRMMYDAAAAVTVATQASHDAAADHTATAAADKSTVASLGNSSADTQAAADNSKMLAQMPNVQTPSATTGQDNDRPPSSLDAGGTAPANNENIHELVFIDSRVPDIDDLVNGVKPGDAVFVLDSSKDGVQQIADIIAANNFHDLSAIQIVSHGDPGTISIGSTTLSDATLAGHADALSAIGASLAAGGDILLYGCSVGDGAAGRQFLTDLSGFVRGADIASSNDPVGTTRTEIDWTLEVSVGTIEATNPFTDAALADYHGVLASNTVSSAGQTAVWDQSEFISENSSDISTATAANDFVLDGARSLTGFTAILTDDVANDNGRLDSFSGTLGWAIYADNGGHPGALLYSGQDAAPALTDTGSQDDFGSDIVRADVSFSGAITLAKGSYWLALHEGNWGSAYDGSTVWWQWSGATNGLRSEAGTSETDPQTWKPDVNQVDNAFALWGATAWDQGSFVPDNSDDISTVAVANDFVLDGPGSLTGFSAVLSDDSRNNNGVLDSFSGTLGWAIYADNGGHPGALLYSGQDTAPVLTDTGAQDADGDDIVRADVSFSGSLTLAKGTYWLAIHEGAWGSAFDGSRTWWQWSSVTTGVASVEGSPVTGPNGWAPVGSPRDTAFTLWDTPVWDQSTFSTQNSADISTAAVANDFTVTGTQSLGGATVWLTDEATNDNGVLDSFSGTLGYAIYADDGGRPGALLGSGQDAAPVVTDTGVQDDFNSDIARVDFSFSTSIVLGSGRYWLAIHEGNWGSADDGSTIWWQYGLANFGDAQVDGSPAANPASWSPEAHESVFVVRSSITDAQNDTATVAEHGSVGIHVQANDIFDSPTHAITAVGSAAHGTVTLDTNGTTDASDDFLVYTPTAGYSGTDHFSYTVSSSGISDAATVDVTTVILDHPPVIAAGDTIQSATVAELTDTTGSNSADQATGTIHFTDVDLTDSHQVNVSLVSDAWTRGAIPGATHAALLTALSTALTDSTANGNGSVAWTFSVADHLLDFLGATESLTATYQVSVDDGHGGTDATTVTITVTGADDAPAVVSVSHTTADTADVDAGTVVASGNVLSGDRDPDSNDTLSVSKVNGQAVNVDAGATGSYGTLLLDADGGYIYTANPAFDAVPAGSNPTDAFTFTVSDGHGGTVDTTLTIDITGANDTPVVVPHGGTAIDTAAADAGTVVANVSALNGVLSGDSDRDSGDVLSVTAVNGSAPGTGVAGTYGTLAVAADGSYTYTANAAFDALATGQNAADSFTVTVSDGHGGNVSSTLRIDVTGGNDAAVLSSDVRSLTETNSPVDISSFGTLTISDVDSPQSFVAQTTAGSYGTFALQTGGTWTYSASGAHDEFVAGTIYTDTFNVASADGTTTSVTIHIAGTNDAAVLSSDTRSLTETNSAADISSTGTLTISDVDSPESFVAQTTAGSYGAFALQTGGGWTYTASSAHDEFVDGTTYTDTFNVASADGTTTSVIVHILGTNDAAVLSSDVRNLTETNSPADISSAGTLTVSDVDSPETFVAQTTAGSYGTFALQADGGWTYIASSAHDEFVVGTTYTDAFNVASADGTTTSVTIHILGTNDAAVLSSDARNFTETNSAADISSSGTLTITDVDSSASFVAQTTAGQYGTFALQAGGGWTYTAGSAHDEFAAGTTYTDTFSVASADGTATNVTIHIGGTNDAAVLSSDTRNLAETNSAADISSTGTLTITDIDSPQAFVTLSTAGQYGTFALQTGGTWTYTAGSAHDEFVAGTTYSDTFNVVSFDGTATSVTIHIAGTNDAPVVVAGNAQDFNANAGKPIAIDPAIALHDVDGTTLSSARVAIAGGFDAGHDSLGFVNQLGISGNYDSAAGVLTLSGTASIADYQAALASVTFGSTSQANAGRTVQWAVDDGSALSSQSAAVVSTLNVNGIIVPLHLFTVNHVTPVSQNTAPAEPPADSGPSFQLGSLTFGDGQGAGGGNGFHVVHTDPVLTTASDATMQINLALAALEAPLGGDVASVVARQANGDPLPDWLKFDPATGQFAGLPPDNAVASLAPQQSDNDIVTGSLPTNPDLGTAGSVTAPQTITVEVLVRDSKGNVAVTTFTIDLRAHVAGKQGWNIDRHAPFSTARHAAVPMTSPELAAIEAAVRDVTIEPPFAWRGMPVRHGDAITVGPVEVAPAGRAGLTEQMALIGWRSMTAQRNALLASLGNR